MGIVAEGHVGGRLANQLLFRKGTLTPFLEKVVEIEFRVVVVVV